MTDLSNSKVTYSFTSDGVDAELDGRVIASGANMAEAETAAHEAIKTASKEPEEAVSRKTATRVTTPNGLTGTILGRTSGIWGEEITVRFENGHISKLNTSSAGLTFSNEKTLSSTPLEVLASIADKSVPGDAFSLAERLNELKELRNRVAKMASRLSHDELVAAHEIVSRTHAEEEEIREVLAAQVDHEEEEFAPYRPEARSYDESWLDRVAAEEVESATEDFDEKVATFVTALSTDTLADGSLVSQIVYDKVSSETDDEEYIESFIEAAEQVRQNEHNARREATKQARLASEKNIAETTDESFLW